MYPHKFTKHSPKHMKNSYRFCRSLLVLQLEKEVAELMSTHKCKVNNYHQYKLHINKHNINFQTLLKLKKSRAWNNSHLIYVV